MIGLDGMGWDTKLETPKAGVTIVKYASAWLHIVMELDLVYCPTCEFHRVPTNRQRAKMMWKGRFEGFSKGKLQLGNVLNFLLLFSFFFHFC